MQFPTILVGASEIDMTPPVGMKLSGYFYERISEGVILPLKANALVLGEGDNLCALVSLDLCGLPKVEADIVRQAILRETGIPPERVMLCCTHAHTGPTVRGRKDWEDVPLNVEYMDRFESLLAKVVAQAKQNQAPALVCAGMQPEEGLAFNRRFRMRDCTEQFGPNKMRPTDVNIDEDDTYCAGPAGPIDTDFSVIAFKRELTAEPFALIVNYALHVDVTSGNKITSDYPGVMREELKNVYGEGLVTLFLQGASGNINHCPYLQQSPYPHVGEWKSRQIGRAFAGKAMNIAEKALPSQSNVVKMVRTVLEVPKYPKNDQAVQDILARIKSKKPEELTFFEESFVKRYEEYSDEGIDEREVFTLRLGEAALCSVPGELFVEWGLEIKKWSPFKYTFIAELCNDSVGYIPTFEAIRRGGYETTPIISVRSTPALGLMIADANFRNLQELHAE
ncbi:MAG: hypothetical protein J6866_07760 [Victivallales bacterium]|nr:hypothetical protein [Victivallales bacterium]